MFRRFLFCSGFAVCLATPATAQRTTSGQDTRDLYREAAAEDNVFPPQAGQDQRHTLRQSRDTIRSKAPDVLFNISTY